MLVEILWNIWCIVSIIGVWPRFIEPRLLTTTRLKLKINNLHKDLENIKILHFSDLHFNKSTSKRFLKRICKKASLLKPDIILFSGDLLCYSRLEEETRLLHFLNSLHAPYGCFLVFGNHDYQKYASVSREGKYDLVEERKYPFIIEGFRKLFHKQAKAKGFSARVHAVDRHEEFCKLLKKTSFEILENETKKIPIGNSFLNISGLGEYCLGKCLPEKAFKEYDEKFPGLVLSHNPDSFMRLKDWPGDIVLSGHTHGGQVNLPFMRNKFIYLENKKWMRGFVQEGEKKLYVNRGVGSHSLFRWFSPPELLLLTMQNAKGNENEC